MRTFVVFLWLSYLQAFVIVVAGIFIFIKAFANGMMEPGLVRIAIALTLIVASVPPYKWILGDYTEQS